MTTRVVPTARLVLLVEAQAAGETKQQMRKRVVALVDAMMETVRVQLLDDTVRQLQREGISI